MVNDQNQGGMPNGYSSVLALSEKVGFTMPSEVRVGSLLRTLIASKPNAHVLELGTGTGLSLSWMIDGLDQGASLVSVDNDRQLSHLVSRVFGGDERVNIVCKDGFEWISTYAGEPFDLIFADTWPGKYEGLEETLKLLKIGGFYVVDDMEPQANWPEGHQRKANNLIQVLEQRDDMTMTKMKWATGLIIAVKNK
ncbi:O-methyltransferase [Spongiimicrobium salis]|uniref:O-methyltransferase n=1 Tax=Spongiimicrobium salis TaxID=1667022 RepID=UPI00374DBA76